MTPMEFYGGIRQLVSDHRPDLSGAFPSIHETPGALAAFLSQHFPRAAGDWGSIPLLEVTPRLRDYLEQPK